MNHHTVTHSALENHHVHHTPETNNPTLSSMSVPAAAVIASSAVNAGLAISYIKAIDNEKQGPSTAKVVTRSGIQLASQLVVGGIVLGVAATLSPALLPMTFLVTAAGTVVTLICSSATFGVTLYYNKLFVAKKLRNIENSVKNIPTGGISLDQKKSLIGLINNSLSILHGSAEKGIKKSSKKIKKLDFQILFNLTEMKKILSSPTFIKSMEYSKEVQKYGKKIDKEIDELLEHSVLFSMLVHEMKHLKELYEQLNIIKTKEQTNKNQDIQNTLAQINSIHLNKVTKYTNLLERFKKEQEYTESSKGKWRAASKMIISCIPEKKQFVQLHEEVIDLASEINDDYQEIKKIIQTLQDNLNAFTLETSKQQFLEIYSAYKKILSYKDANKTDVNHSLDGVKDEMSKLGGLTTDFSLVGGACCPH